MITKHPEKKIICFMWRRYKFSLWVVVISYSFSVIGYSYLSPYLNPKTKELKL